ncbi:GFA family protein [Rhizobium sp. SG2393]|uniref:GFA family protein n=1 Tax=Rhizobium sp. SG2393 TaxID=3276279 RepID=UPI0036713968
MTERLGGCLCGAVRFAVSGPLREVVFCHCSQCRRQTGLYYASTNAARADVAISGEGEITWYGSSAHGRRGFCRQCGSALFWSYEGAEGISIQAGAFDQPSGLQPGYHIFAADKADFYEIADGLQQFAKGRPGLLTDG